jgi:O-antigen ligase
VIHKFRLAIVPAFLLLCLLFGGASAAGFWANMVLQLIALAIIVWAALVERQTPLAAPARRLLVLLGLALALAALHLIPLPPAIWTSFAGRESVAQGYRMLGEPLPWLPLSLAPYRTWGSVLWLLPAIATLLGMLRLGGFRSSWIAWVLCGVTIVSVTLGAVQIAGGQDSPFYFYQITNWGKAVGFFANSNHMGMLMVATVPFLAALFFDAKAKGRSINRASGLAVMLAGALAVIAVGIAINASLAGMGLIIPVAGISMFALGSRNRKRIAFGAIAGAVLLVAAVVLVFTAPVGGDLTSASASDTGSRYFFLTTTMKAVADFFPWGTGLGTFVDVYPMYEDPAGVTRLFANHAHDDYVELLLETGVPGVLLVLVFLLWFGARTVAVWRAEQPDYFARAATVAGGALLAHSFVDYPLRTAALSALFAVCCALMAEARPRARRRHQPKETPSTVRHLSAD